MLLSHDMAQMISLSPVSHRDISLVNIRIQKIELTELLSALNLCILINKNATEGIPSTNISNKL